MEQDINGPQDLAACWRRFDWRENFLAPGLVILQALTPQGQTASGAGLTRAEAWDRCLGETAEILALSRYRAANGSFETHRDGIASHADSAIARASALHEAYERHAVAGWWLGALRASPVDRHWLQDSGLLRLHDDIRDGAALKRRTDWWQIDAPGGPAVMICRSMSLEGQEPILGYGVHPEPRLAAEKALREMLLMEINLMELLAARSHGLEPALAPVGRRIRDYALRGTSLFVPAPAVIPAPWSPPETDWFAQPPRLARLALAPVSVWLCQPDLPAPAFTDQTGSPYL